MIQPIGIFDSGVGGTSILTEVHQLLPYEDIIYLSDSKNAPYGDKTSQEIIQLSIKNTELLKDYNCKLIVVACNTATTNAIAYLRANYELPFIGIEPAIKPAALKTKTKAIGILATRGTLSSALFHKTSNLFAKDVNVVEQIGVGIVSLIENGKLYSNDMKILLKEYLQPMINANIDHLVLGCTHYAYLTPILKNLLPENVKIIDSGLAVAKQTKHLLEINELQSTTKKKGEVLIYTNGNPEILYSITRQRFKISEQEF